MRGSVWRAAYAIPYTQHGMVFRTIRLRAGQLTALLANLTSTLEARQKADTCKATVGL